MDLIHERHPWLNDPRSLGVDVILMLVMKINEEYAKEAKANQDSRVVDPKEWFNQAKAGLISITPEEIEKSRQEILKQIEARKETKRKGKPK